VVYLTLVYIDLTYLVLETYQQSILTLRCVIPVGCVTNEREESVVNQHSKFRNMLYSNNETTCFGRNL